MGKVDLSRDYYGDLGISSSSDIAEIKKQYKKLALIYHPDRNIGNNNLDATKFQKIQSAYEILIDSTERAKYDANRRNGVFRTGLSNKGNPWSHVGRDYPPPPKPPTARNRPAPPPSNGARRYEKFATPHKSAYQASYEGAQARKATYDAWENMRSHHGSDKAEPNLGTNSGAPRPPPRGPAQSRRVDTDPIHQNSRESHTKSKDNYTSTRKNGFMPSTPGGDEQPAPKTAYFTKRDKQDAPPIPPRNPEFTTVAPDSAQEPLSYVEKKPVLESRTSTPYATQGGERLNPFEAPSHLNRSKSCHESLFSSKEGPQSTEDQPIPRTTAAHRTRSFGERHSKEKLASYTKRMKEAAHNFGGQTPETTQKSKQNVENNPPPIRPMFTHPNYKGASVSPESDGPTIYSAQAKTPLSSESNISNIGKSSEMTPKKSWESKYESNKLILFPSCHIKVLVKASECTNLDDDSFSFKIEDDMFVTTNSPNHDNSYNNHGDKIGNRFMAKDWDGTFAAGSDSNFFEPILIPGQISPRRTQSSNRVQTRSPIKVQNPSTNTTSTETTPNIPTADAGFFPADWAETFKPQTFMPSPVPAQPPTVSTIRKKSIPISRSAATMEDKSSGIDEKVAFANNEGRVSSPPLVNIATPEPMDIDTPHTFTTEFVAPILLGASPKMNSDSQKRRVSHSSHLPNETDVQASALKVHFSDLKIKDLILDLPPPPNPPILPQEKKPSISSYLNYELTYEQYMADWDHFDKKFLLHFVARKNNNEQLGNRRWRGDEVEAYRATILEDQAVLNKWAEAKEVHAKAVKDWNIYRELKREHDQNERPRKKTA